MWCWPFWGADLWDAGLKFLGVVVSVCMGGLSTSFNLQHAHRLGKDQVVLLT